MNRADPCDLLPDPPGKAKGHDKRCPPEGSSGGVAKGDFNADGFADLAIGVPFENIGTVEDAGAVHVIYGGPNGLTVGGGASGIPAAQFWHQDFSDPTLGGVKDFAEENDRSGSALAAGDFNGDHFSDLAIGVPEEDISGGDYTGAVHVLFGTAAGLTASANQIDDQFFTYNLAGFLHEIPTGVCHLPGGCPPDAGEVLILFGSSPDGLSTAGHQVIVQGVGTSPFIIVGDSSEEANDRFGSVLAAGDFDNDTFDDLVIGVPKEDLERSNAPTLVNAGTVHVVFGSTSGFSSLRWLNLNERNTAFPNAAVSSGTQLGRALAAGDFDGDSRADLAVSAPFEDVGNASTAGKVYVLAGINSLGPAGIQSWHQATPGIQENAEEGAHFGKALAAGDFNADGRSDLAIGVPDEDLLDVAQINQINAGGLHIIYGSGTGLTASGDQFFSQGNIGRIVETGDQFGASLTAWNFGRNERVELRDPLRFVTIQTADLAIGVPGEGFITGQGVPLVHAGGVNVLYGHSILRLSSTANQFWHQTIPGTDTPDSDEAGDQMETDDVFGTTLY